MTKPSCSANVLMGRNRSAKPSMVGFMYRSDATVNSMGRSALYQRWFWSEQVADTKLEELIQAIFGA